MMPKLHSDNFPGIELIRPMYLVHEEDVIAWRNNSNLTFLHCACRFTESCSVDNEINVSRRLTTKKLIQMLKENYNEEVEKHIFSAATNVNMDMIIGYKKDGVKQSFLEEYDED